MRMVELFLDDRPQVHELNCGLVCLQDQPCDRYNNPLSCITFKHIRHYKRFGSAVMKGQRSLP